MARKPPVHLEALSLQTTDLAFSEAHSGTPNKSRDSSIVSAAFSVLTCESGIISYLWPIVLQARFQVLCPQRDLDLSAAAADQRPCPLHFAAEETEAQAGSVTCLRPARKGTTGMGS